MTDTVFLSCRMRIDEGKAVVLRRLLDTPGDIDECIQWLQFLENQERRQGIDARNRRTRALRDARKVLEYIVRHPLIGRK